MWFNRGKLYYLSIIDVGNYSRQGTTFRNIKCTLVSLVAAVIANKNSFIITFSVTIGTHRDARECELAPEPPRPGDHLNSPHVTAQTCKV